MMTNERLTRGQNIAIVLIVLGTFLGFFSYIQEAVVEEVAGEAVGATVEALTIKEKVAGKGYEERRAIIVEEVAKVATPETFTRGEYIVEMIQVVPQGKYLEVYARAHKGGKKVGLGDGTVETERFRFFNPQFEVPDGTTRLEQVWTPDGIVERPVANQKEDPQGALREQLLRAIKRTGTDDSRIVPGKVGNTTYVFQPDGTTGDDNSLDSLDPNGNYDTNTNTFIGDAASADVENIRIAIRFTEISTIPSTETVSSVTLALEILSTGAAHDDTAAIDLQRLLRTWVEAEATWNVYSTGNSWTTAGAGSDGNDRDADVSATQSSQNRSGNTLTWDSTATFVDDVQKWVDGTYAANDGWVIHSPLNEDGGATNKSAEFATSNNATAANRPELTVVTASAAAGYEWGTIID